MKNALSTFRLALAIMALLPSSALAGGFYYEGVYYGVLHDFFDTSLGVYGHARVVNNGSTGCYSGDVVIPELVPYADYFLHVTTIGKDAFNYCNDLTSVTLPNTITRIDETAFNGCSNLKSVNIPPSVTSMGQSVFSYCPSLTAIDIPDGVTSINYGTFWGCTKLKDVKLSNNITYIGIHAFSGCDSLSEITLPGSLTTIAYEAFSSCDNLKHVTIPDSVTSIGPCAFRACTGMKSLIIGKGVTIIDYYAFGGCNSLEDIVCKAITPPAMPASGGYPQFTDYATPVLYVPAASLEAYRASEYWGKFNTILSIEEIVGKHKGDVNRDGEINIADTNSVIEVVIRGGNSGHTRVPDPDGGGWIDLADINDDGEVNLADVNALISNILSNNQPCDVAN